MSTLQGNCKGFGIAGALESLGFHDHVDGHQSAPRGRPFIRSMRSGATIHIGLPKTGTTSVQRFLALNAERLAEVGISYPRFLKKENHHALAAYGVGSQIVHMSRMSGLNSIEEWQAWRPRFRREFLEHTTGGGHWIFSSEHIASRLNTHERIGSLMELLDEAFEQCRIIVYVRRQDEMAISSYSTWVRDGLTREFDIDEHIEMRNRYDFRMIIERWMAYLPKEAISIRLLPNERSDATLIEDFAAAIGIGDITNWKLPPRMNTTLSAPEVEFLRRLNEKIPHVDEQSRYRDPARYVQGAIPGPLPFLDLESANRIMSAYRVCNEWVMRQVDSPVADPDYFAPPSPRPQNEQPVELTADMGITVAARLWKGLNDAAGRTQDRRS